MLTEQDEQARREPRKEQHRKEVAANKAKVDAHKKSQKSSGSGSASSSS